MNGISFLDLPRELRDMTYAYVLPSTMQLVTPGCDSALEFSNKNGILLANRQTRDEALEALHRSPPSVTIVTHHNALLSRLVSPDCIMFRQKIVTLIVRTEYGLEEFPHPHYFLRRKSEEHTKIYIHRVIESMSALQHITCEVGWLPNQPPAVLLPLARAHMLGQIRAATLGFDPFTDWVVECHVRHATRWRNEWSGIVLLIKR